MPESRSTAVEGRSFRFPALLLTALALLSMAGPVATDLYLPAFPEMAREFGVSASAIQLTLTGFLLGMGAGQLLFGPLSDRFGRVRPLLIGSSVFVLSSVAVALAPTIETLTAFRFLQGLSAAAGVVLSRAVISDRAVGGQAARLFSIMMTISGVAPAVAPSVGSLIFTTSGWRAVLWAIAVMSVVMLLGALWQVRETLPVAHRRTGPLFGGLAEAMRHRRFVGYIVLFGAAFGILMGYISASPFLYQGVLGLSPGTFALLFGANALGMMSAGLVSARLATRIPLRSTVTVAVSTLVTVTVAFTLCALLAAPGWILAALIFATTCSIGFVMGNTTSLALAEVRQISGSGSAWLGGAQFTLGAIVSPLGGLGGSTSALPLGLVLLGCSLLAAGALVATSDRFHTEATR
ncbi:multidrug effflux MFS transporter [Arthrobacter rhombi]|uniref:multidrug effflux MFS transporter n=1 Tax=Arthrobacter rhombi TaxID=71253 RepID=UPI003F92AF03